MICGACGETTLAEPCASCGETPLVDGRYELQRELGRGGLGITYEARRKIDGAPFALKELPYRNVKDLKTLELFEREARVLRELDRAGIPKYVDHFVFGRGKHRAFYVVQELIRGQTIEALMETRRFSEAETVKILSEVADILAYLHALHPPVIHRDIKPSNIMIDEAARVWLLDFGSVRDVIKDPKLGGSTVTGTFGFMAPEQFQGLATSATDVFALGVTALVMLTRLQPSELFDTLGRPIWSSKVSVSDDFEALLREMTLPDPAVRPSEAETIRSRLEDIAAGRVRVLPRPNPPAPLVAPTRKEARFLARGSGALLFGVVVVGAASEVVRPIALLLGLPLSLTWLFAANDALRGKNV